MGTVKRCLWIGLWMWPTLLIAAPTPADQQVLNAAQNRTQTIIESELKAQREIREQSRKKPAPSSLPRPSVDDVPIEVSDRHFFHIKRIILKGDTQLGKLRYRRLLRRYEDSVMNKYDIDWLIRDLTNAYIDHGDVTTRVYLPKQNLQSGTLVLQVTTGTVERFEFEPTSPGDESQLFWAYPMREGKALNIRDIEDGLDTINRLPSNRATVQFLPGSDTGKTRVRLANRRSNSLRASLNYNNASLYPMGLFPNQFTIEKDNLLTINDMWTLGFSQSSGANGQNSQSQSLSVSVPYDKWRWDLSYSRFEYNQLVSTGGQSFKTTGQTETNTVKLSRRIWRDQRSKLTGYTQIESQNVDAFQDGSFSPDTSRRTRVWTIGLDGSTRTQWGVWSGSVATVQGLNNYDATLDIDTIRPQDPHAQFTKTTAGLTAMIPTTVAAWPVTVQSTLKAQLSPVALYSSQEMSIGDIYSVRGYNALYLQGETGWLSRNEFITPLNRILPYPWLRAQGPETQLYWALDAGYIESRDAILANTNIYDAHLYGAGLGIRHITPHVVADILYSIPLRVSPITRSGDLDLDEYLFYMSLTFKVI